MGERDDDEDEDEEDETEDAGVVNGAARRERPYAEYSSDGEASDADVPAHSPYSRNAVGGARRGTNLHELPARSLASAFDAKQRRRQQRPRARRHVPDLQLANTKLYSPMLLFKVLSCVGLDSER